MNEEITSNYDCIYEDEDSQKLSFSSAVSDKLETKVTFEDEVFIPKKRNYILNYFTSHKPSNYQYEFSNSHNNYSKLDIDIDVTSVKKSEQLHGNIFVNFTNKIFITDVEYINYLTNILGAKKINYLVEDLDNDFSVPCKSSDVNYSSYTDSDYYDSIELLNEDLYDEYEIQNKKYFILNATSNNNSIRNLIHSVSLVAHDKELVEEAIDGIAFDNSNRQIDMLLDLIIETKIIEEKGFSSDVPYKLIKERQINLIGYTFIVHNNGIEIIIEKLLKLEPVLNFISVQYILNTLIKLKGLTKLNNPVNSEIALTLNNLVNYCYQLNKKI